MRFAPLEPGCFLTAFLWMQIQSFSLFQTHAFAQNTEENQELFACAREAISKSMSASFENLDGEKTDYLLKELGNGAILIAPAMRVGKRGMIVQQGEHIYFHELPCTRSSPRSLRRIKLNLTVQKPYLDIVCSNGKLGPIFAKETAPRGDKYEEDKPNNALSSETLIPIQNVVISYAAKTASICDSRKSSLPVLEHCKISDDSAFTEVRRRLREARFACDRFKNAPLKIGGGSNQSAGTPHE